MLFSSFDFICVFLPILGAIFGLLQKNNAAALWLLLIASFIFYANHRLFDLGLMVFSILINFTIGNFIQNNKKVFVFGILFNLGVIGYFKYSFFILDNLNSIFLVGFNYERIILPLGVSFFTFQQIAYLVDTYRGDKPETNILKYALLVSFFPHSIAGPLVQYKEISPQFNHVKLSIQNLAIGGTIFIIGLFKKVVIADSLAPCVNAIFDQIPSGLIPTFAESWFAAISYTFQLYFDFSGYSDMALGLARIFNIRFPVNFDSPYRSISIIEFWRRWHITLSAFLKNYVYISFGGNRNGSFKRYRNLFLTMLVGGLWHGANWTFVLWGAMHGGFLVINHLWHSHVNLQYLEVIPRSIRIVVSWLVTMLLVIFAWVVFRAESIQDAIVIYKSMIGIHGISVPIFFKNFVASSEFLKFDGFFSNQLFEAIPIFVLIVISCVLVLLMPNIKNFFHFYMNEYPVEKAWGKSIIRLSWSAQKVYAFLIALMTVSIIFAMLSHREIDFLYFNF